MRDERGEIREERGEGREEGEMGDRQRKEGPQTGGEKFEQKQSKGSPASILSKD